MFDEFSEIVGRIQQKDVELFDERFKREQAENAALRRQASPGGLSASELLEKLSDESAPVDAPLEVPKSADGPKEQSNGQPRGRFPAPPKSGPPRP